MGQKQGVPVVPRSTHMQFDGIPEQRAKLFKNLHVSYQVIASLQFFTLAVSSNAVQSELPGAGCAGLFRPLGGSTRFRGRRVAQSVLGPPGVSGTNGDFIRDTCRSTFGTDGTSVQAAPPPPKTTRQPPGGELRCVNTNRTPPNHPDPSSTRGLPPSGVQGRVSFYVHVRWVWTVGRVLVTGILIQARVTPNNPRWLPLAGYKTPSPVIRSR